MATVEKLKKAFNGLPSLLSSGKNLPVVRRIDELSNGGYGFEVKFSNIWHLELPGEELGVSGSGDICGK